LPSPSIEVSFEAYKRGWISSGSVDAHQKYAMTVFWTKEFSDVDSIFSSFEIVETYLDFENKLVKFFIRKPQIRRVAIDFFSNREIRKSKSLLLIIHYNFGTPLEYSRPEGVPPSVPQLDFPSGPSPIFEHWAYVRIEEAENCPLDPKQGLLVYFDELPPEPPVEVYNHVLTNPSENLESLTVSVDREWMEESKIDKDSLVVMKLENGKWVRIEHKILSFDENGVVLFVPLSGHHSLFVIGGRVSRRVQLYIVSLLVIVIVLVLLYKRIKAAHPLKKDSPSVTWAGSTASSRKVAHRWCWC
jgi:hypothetical protein